MPATTVNIPSRYNNTIESIQGVLKEGMETCSMSIEDVMMVMNLRIIHFNFFHKHSSIGDRTPAAAGKYNGSFDRFSGLIDRSRRHDKAFLVNLNHRLCRHIRFEVRVDAVSVTADPDMTDKVAGEINGLIQTEGGFALWEIPAGDACRG